MKTSQDTKKEEDLLAAQRKRGDTTANWANTERTFKRRLTKKKKTTQKPDSQETGKVE